MVTKTAPNMQARNVRLTGEICVRTILIVIFVASDSLEPFRRKIQPEEIWLYKNPQTDSYVPTTLLMTLATFVPVFVFMSMAFIQKEKADVIPAGLGLSLSLGITGILTNLVKITVGRPRPDFFWRCFPDGKVNPEMSCTGLPHVIREGFKSFPSGHSSVAFATLGFASFYMAGKMHCFTARGRGQSWRFCLCVMPMVLALLIALSRTCDYHHHWQDVLVGSLLGLVMAYLCYRQYFPSLDCSDCDRAYDSLFQFPTLTSSSSSSPSSSASSSRALHEHLITVKSV